MTGFAPIVFALSLTLMTTAVLAQESADATLTNSDGKAVTWSACLEDQAPAVVLLWGTWNPEGDSVLADTTTIHSIAVDRGFNFFIVALQEPWEESSAALDGREVTWFHDRHGALLKVLRVYDVPSLVIVSEDGSVLTRIEASSKALSGWREP